MAVKIKEIIIKARIGASAEDEDRPSPLPDREMQSGPEEARPPLGERFLKRFNSQENER
jgi:hypothetical protein